MAGVFDFFGYGNTGGRGPANGNEGRRPSRVRTRKSSIGGATYMHAPEYHGETVRKDSVSSIGSSSGDEKSSSSVVDLNKISHDEFERLYHGMRKGEPSNRVNF